MGVLAALAASMLIVSSGTLSAQNERRPNILFAFADDWGDTRAPTQRLTAKVACTMS